MLEDPTNLILEYYAACREVQEILNCEQQRKHLCITAIGLKHLLNALETAEDSNELISNLKTSFIETASQISKQRIEQESKINSQSIELSKLKSFKGDKESYEKEIHSLKMQVNKLNKQIVDSNIEREKIKESAKRQRALLESKLDAARRKGSSNFDLKENNLSTGTVSNDMSNDSNKKNGRKTLDTPSVRTRNTRSSTPKPISASFNKNASSTIGLSSSIKKTNTLNKLFKTSSSLTGDDTIRKRSLFDDDDDEDDLFNQPIANVAKEHATKKKLISKPTIENDDVEKPASESIPNLPNPSNLLKLSVSPLKPRTEHQGAFKFKLK